MRNDLNRGDLEGLHSVLRRAAERAEKRRLAHPEDPAAYDEAAQIAQAVADLEDELAFR